MKKKIKDLDYLEMETICYKHPLGEGCKTCPLNIPNHEHGCIKSLMPIQTFKEFVDYVNSKLNTEVEVYDNEKVIPVLD